MIINASHIAPAQGAFEPQRTSNWSLEVALDDAGDQLLIMQVLEGFEVPEMHVDVLTLGYANENRKVAGKAHVADVQLTLKDMVDPNIAEAVHKWFRKVYNPDTGSIGLAKDYKKNADLVLGAPDQSRIRVYKLHGVWPSSVQGGRLDMNNTAPNLLTVKLCVDRMTLGTGFSSALAGINQGNANAPI